jgi:hypothetical protein
MVGVSVACGNESWPPVAPDKYAQPLEAIAIAKMPKIAHAFVFIVRLTSISHLQLHIKHLCIRAQGQKY